jgi:tellurite resistance protein TehA-like permease
VENILCGLIGIVGLGAFGFGQLVKENDVYTLSGCIIWVGTLFFYFLSGIIVQNVTGVELRMGYGGWYTPKKRKRYSSKYNKKKN